MSKISPKLLDKYIRNACTEQEKQQVEVWYASLQGKPDFLGSLPEDEQQKLQDETRLNIQHQLGIEPTTGGRSISWRWTAWLAATLLLILGLYVTYRNVNEQAISVRPASVQKSQLTDLDLKNSIRYVNRQSRPVKHTLPDGSTVWLQAGAMIMYPQKFDKAKRLVTFSGEGFFNVKKDKKCPFFIQSGEMNIKVLGTSFNVKAQPSRKVFQIAVVTGRVQVSAPDPNQNKQQVILKPKQQAIFEIETKRLVATSMPTQLRKEIYEPISILFDNVPLNKVVENLQKRYHVTFRLSNPRLSSCRVSADFEHQALPVIMEMLCTALDVTYTMANNTILIDGTPCE